MLARQVLPQADDVNRAEAEMDARLAARGAGGYGFTGPTAGLFMAMQGAPGVSMMSIGRDPDGMLRATLAARSEEHTSELQSLMRISYAVFCLKNKHNLHDTAP